MSGTFLIILPFYEIVDYRTVLCMIAEFLFVYLQHFLKNQLHLLKQIPKIQGFNSTEWGWTDLQWPDQRKLEPHWNTSAYTRPATLLNRNPTYGTNKFHELYYCNTHSTYCTVLTYTQYCTYCTTVIQYKICYVYMALPEHQIFKTTGCRIGSLVYYKWPREPWS